VEVTQLAMPLLRVSVQWISTLPVCAFGVSSGPCWTEFQTIAHVNLQDLNGQRLISKEARSNWTSDNRRNKRGKTFTSWSLLPENDDLIELRNIIIFVCLDGCDHRFLDFQIRNQELQSLSLNMFMTNLLLKVFVSRYLCIQSLTVLSVPQILFVLS
jgi:hypothetical protein